MTLTGRKDSFIIISLRAHNPVRNLFSRVSERLDIPVDEFLMFYGSQLLHYDSNETFEDYDIKHNSLLHVVQRVIGGGTPDLYTYFDDCLLKHQCPFHGLFRWSDIFKLSQKQENAYNLLCRKFNLPDEVIRGIEDTNEAKGVRLVDVLHWIYHKDPSITWQRIKHQLL